MQSTKATNTHYVGNPPVLQTYNVYALVCGYCSGTVTNSDYFGVGGQNYFGYHHNEAPGFDYTFAAGNVQVDPQFVSPAIPASTPDCGNAATVIVCAAPIIAGFKTQNPAVAGMGYQPPGACVPDQYWPSSWLPVSLVPDGLVTKPCS